MSQAIPISKHKSRGTFRKARHAGKFQPVSERLGAAPEWFTEVQREEWDRIAAMEHIRASHKATAEHAVVLYLRFLEDAKGTRAMTASERQAYIAVYRDLITTPASEAKAPERPVAKSAEWAQFG